MNIEELVDEWEVETVDYNMPEWIEEAVEDD